MVEEEVIASQLEDLVKPVLLVQQKYYQQLGPAKPNSQPPFNGSCGVNFTVAKRGSRAVSFSKKAIAKRGQRIIDQPQNRRWFYLFFSPRYLIRINNGESFTRRDF